MTSLRMRVVEALKPYIDVDPAIEPNEWSLAQRYNAGLALDAMLDVLAGNADEWADYPAEADPIVVAHREIIARKLVDALREDR